MKTIAVTMGEPGGIGPEVALKAVHGLRSAFAPLLVGDRTVFDDSLKMLGLPIELVTVQGPKDVEAGSGPVPVIDVGRYPDFAKGRPTAQGGQASVASIKRAVGLAMRGEADAVVTAPISKEALRMAGEPWPGHTEMLAELSGAREFGMMLMGSDGERHLRVMLVTIHRALREVPGLITEEAVIRAIHLARKACLMLGMDSPRIAVAGLNPHAGEGGMFGLEEEETIAPAVRKASVEGAGVSGPWPPDTVYHRAWGGEFDIVVSMYHDQGLIPLKLVAFDRGVNVTVGLPFVRTSPDHGTAYDIAWRGVAGAESMVEAVRAALAMRKV